MLSMAATLGAANPYLDLDSGEPLVSQWSGSEWGDGIKAPTEDGRPMSAAVSVRRLARMPWGQIVRMRFDVEGDREIAPVYLLVRNEMILELAGDDIEFVIGAIAGMAKPPHFDPQNVRATSADGRSSVPDGAGEATVTTAGGVSTYLWSHPSGHFRKMVWSSPLGLVEYAAGSGARKDGFRLAPAGPDEFLANEKLGKLALGMPDGEVLKLLGGPAGSTRPVLQEATGEWVVDRSWPDQGLELGMVADGKDGPWSVGNITAKAPCRLATAGGIRVGSLEADVKAAYGKVRSAEDSVPGKCFVAGSIFGGVIFDLKDGVVTRIFLGAAAE